MAFNFEENGMRCKQEIFEQEGTEIAERIADFILRDLCCLLFKLSGPIDQRRGE